MARHTTFRTNQQTEIVGHAFGTISDLARWTRRHYGRAKKRVVVGYVGRYDHSQPEKLDSTGNASYPTMRYEDIVLKLGAKIISSINWFVQYSKSIHRTQQAGESADFIKELAESCNFSDKKTRLVLGQFVSGLRDPLVQSKLLELHATLTDEIALTMG